MEDLRTDYEVESQDRIEGALRVASHMKEGYIQKIYFSEVRDLIESQPNKGLRRYYQRKLRDIEYLNDSQEDIHLLLRKNIRLITN